MSTIIEIILWAIYLIAFFIVLSANIHTTQSETKQQREVQFARNQASRIQMMLGRYLAGKLDRKLEKAYDLLFTGPTGANADIELLEWDVSIKIDSLENALKAGNAEEAEKHLDELLLNIERMHQAIRFGKSIDE